MKVTVTRYEPHKAGFYQDGRLRAFDLVPPGADSSLVFHWVEVQENAALDPELNDVDKTFLIAQGSCSIEMEGEQTSVAAGDAAWLPAGSTHVIRNGPSPLKFIVVKSKQEEAI